MSLALMGLGFALGVRHAADPDHVFAVTAIAAHTRRVVPATLLGMAWGLGHSLTLLLVAGGIIVFDWSVPARLGLAMEFCVAMALMALGLLNVRARRHAHGHASAPRSARRALMVGIVHGLSGSAAVALLVVATVREPYVACAYLVLFALGTLVGMALITTGFAIPVATATQRWQAASGVLRVSTGVLTLGFGLWLAYQIGWQDGLFRATAEWVPH